VKRVKSEKRIERVISFELRKEEDGHNMLYPYEKEARSRR
jgi:hypothetical protein